MNVARLLLDGFDAKALRVAVVEGETRRTYAEFVARVRQRAGFLRNVGIEPGDRVACLAPNGSDYLETYFAAAWVGAILQSPNPHLAARELRAVLEDASPKLVLCDSVFAEAVTAAGGVSTEIGSALGPALAGEPIARAAGDTAQLYATSGTTGASKGVQLTHGNLIAHAENVVPALVLTATDRWAHIAPMFHLADAWAVFALSLVGGRHVLQKHFEAGATLELFEREQITITNLVPTMLVRCLVHADIDKRDLAAFRVLLSGGAPLEERWVNAVGDYFGGEYVQTYGMTETSPFLLLGILSDEERSLGRADRNARRARTGRAFPGIDLEVVDEVGTHVDRDDQTVGEIRVRGASVTPGYWKRPKETAAAIRSGWLYSGDLATMDATGSVRVVDRKKDMILTGGENVYSTEVENALVEHPAVVEVAAFGLPDAEWGERVCAAVTLAKAVEPSELRAFCSERLAKFKVPKQIFVLDELPKTASGKLSKSELRVKFARS